MSYWLQLLHSLGILEVVPQGYVPSSLTRTAILNSRSQNSWKFLAAEERERSAGVHELAAFLDMTGVHRLMDAGGGSGMVA
jgi:hypothetical protein